MSDLERNLTLLLPIKPEIKAETQDSLYLFSKNGFSKASAESMHARLQELGLGPQDKLVGLHPGSIWPTKRWPAERYALLTARLVKEAGARVILIGAREDQELSCRIAAQSCVETFDWTGKTTLSELMQLMRRLSLMVTNDSGPMHIAAASGVPTLAIFGPTTRELGFFPHGPGHRVLEKNLACRPCGLHGGRLCPEGHFLCMGLITVEEVFRNAREMIRA
jgi:heptosyltransferase-2